MCPSPINIRKMWYALCYGLKKGGTDGWTDTTPLYYTYHYMVVVVDHVR